MRRVKAHPSQSRPDPDRLGDALVKIFLRGISMSCLYDAHTAHPKDDRLIHMYSHYGVLESYDFIEAVEELQQLAAGDEKTKIDAVKPLVSWLLNYKDGLRQWRHKRIAHLDDLGTPSMVYYGRYKIPFTVEDFNKIYHVIFFLSNYILDVYMQRLLLIRKIMMEKDQKNQIMGYTIETNHDLAKFKDQTVKKLSRISSMFEGDAYHKYVRFLQRLEPLQNMEPPP